MKNKLLISLSFAVILFSACQKEENMYTPDSIAQSEAMKKSKAVSNLDSSLNASPQIRFKFGGKNNQLVRVVLFDSLFKNYDDLKVDVEVLPHSNSDSEKEASTVKPYIKTTAYSQAGVYLYMLRSEPVPYTESFIGKIVDIKLTLISNGQKVDSRSFSVFVFENGKSALQLPGIKTANFVDDWQGESDFLKIILKGENDPAQNVASAAVTISEKTYSGPIKRRTKGGFVVDIDGIETYLLSNGASDVPVNVSLFDTKGVQVGVTESMLLLKPIHGKEAARIHSLRIREVKDENGSLTHQIAGVVLNIKPERLGYVEINFTETNFESKPPTMQQRLQMKQRQLRDLRDLQIYTDWDNIINDYISEIQNNPIFVDNNTEVNPLFETSAIGYSYNVSATMFNNNGKQIGQSQTFEVTVEGETDKTEPVLQSTRLFSTDGGKTWNYEVVIQDNGQWVEKVQVEFVKPYEGSAPVYNPIGLSLVATKEGNIEMYSEKVEFVGNPTGFSYTAIISQFGTGTRRTTSQANNKAELL